MNNPFEPINARLNNLEALTLEVLKFLRTTSIPTDEVDALLTTEETAQLLKVSKVTVWQWSKPTPGILNPRRIGNQVRYLRSEVMSAARPMKGGVAK